MPVSFESMLVQAFADELLADVLNASPAAIHGVSTADADLLQQAFGITTVRQMAENRFFRIATAMAAATGELQHDPGPDAGWQAFFDGAPRLHDLLPSRFRPHFGPVMYRGRLDGTARVLVIGQDPSKFGRNKDIDLERLAGDED